MGIIVRRLNDNDFFEWKPLFQQYAQFYGRPVDDARALTTWGILTDPHQNLFGFVAEQTIIADVHNLQGLVETMTQVHLVGFVHFCAVSRALESDIQMQIQDYYVDPTVRRKGVARGLMDAVKLDGLSRGAKNMSHPTIARHEPCLSMSAGRPSGSCSRRQSTDATRYPLDIRRDSPVSTPCIGR
jgi:GNAT superfamily N-acetyltransferase